ncbi:hypothetical protein A3D80_03230 [Candidatus Roizmanbacteria bacterium RIFCSPHIGHO2_02_FULL_40_13b]|uniref:Fibronectin type-III domain-containing protein n=1 Tax=Candidatus Roizmanbacteria bacterium RIFCSPHIGHO2_01_FULL_39_24 TaxID=1802032 RepID=A0A1F7GLQ2_9BACT|nr:MAG: hypothetical protein A2799_00975 [Candidatus Roizmanbacteria bacterium RIFCSPHIGHO2_01_FULL_39_24]OGK26980.1 MAG: hypothetical protein A3D80_03230 [Candidatus Roizmanbacteria bacterium RIFCSPHIGHO2_02_FULL_40_13b]OGK48865.1 MAG: hypothetical protein A3A56_01495 [Candidatus Roizmanbacteria bacterium RIFCSPLOWO2_01_FULL_40_32]OGK57173.1 MAG: hypothetical protein A3H83_00760 [Candidatus Roizmanbacteria bacterium RIFCSPLOWO2_02_FULL_39_8]
MSDYYKLYTNERRVPGILVVLVVGLIFSIPFFFLHKQTSSPDALGNTSRPVVVEILNQTATSTDIYWKTEKPSIDTLIYWDTAGTKNTVLDIHDIESSKIPRRLHFFSLKNLIAKTTYFLQINHENVLFGSNQQPYTSFTTLMTSAISTTLPPLYGKVVDTAGNPIPDVFLKVRVGKGQRMGAFTKSDGSFLISLCCLYNGETFELYNPARTEIVNLQFENESGLSSFITAPISAVSPFQNSVKLGENSNLVSSLPQEPQVILGAQTGISKDSKTSILAIYYPKDSAVIPGFRPLFKGSAPPNTSVTLSFPKETRSFEIKSDTAGLWEFVPKFNLKVGAQTVIAKSIDTNQKVLTATRVFNIPKSGQDVLGEATGSASLTPTSVPTDVPVITPTVGVTGGPTTGPTLIPSGIGFELFGISGIALMLLGAGIILLF